MDRAQSHRRGIDAVQDVGHSGGVVVELQRGEYLEGLELISVEIRQSGLQETASLGRQAGLLPKLLRLFYLLTLRGLMVLRIGGRDLACSLPKLNVDTDDAHGASSISCGLLVGHRRLGKLKRTQIYLFLSPAFEGACCIFGQRISVADMNPVHKQRNR
ncbi:hypothetical protein B484DRAFT_447045 [Ochromonadaceae sp. CCMP2298]|nr:hypothetical protein B484DRAFT_447045 [Ochromonadaceae sp. CCMP2298]